jgi:hypothetical protein
MMSGVPLETCWAFNKRWNNQFYYNAASCWYFYWVIYDARIYEYQVSNPLLLLLCYIIPVPEDGFLQTRNTQHIFDNKIYCLKIQTWLTVLLFVRLLEQALSTINHNHYITRCWKRLLNTRRIVPKFKNGYVNVISATAVLTKERWLICFTRGPLYPLGAEPLIYTKFISL